MYQWELVPIGHIIVIQDEQVIQKFGIQQVIINLLPKIKMEHLKLIFYPFLVMAIIGYFIIGKRTDNYWFAQTIGILTAMLFTIVFFYTYTGFIGTNIHWLNIATFIMAVIFGQYITYRLLISRKHYNAELVSIFFLIILFLSFILYTINPPLIGLFRNPIISS